MRSLPRLLPACLWAGLIFWLSSQEGLGEVLRLFPGSDKLAHMGAYAVLTGLLLLAADPSDPSPGLRWALVATLYGITDELHQAVVPGRTADLLDLLADAAGAALAVVLWRRARQWLGQRGERRHAGRA